MMQQRPWKGGICVPALGDGNQVNARFQKLGESLAELREAIKRSDRLNETQKMDLVVDVDTLQTQLARTTPGRDLVSRLWESINRTASLAGIAEAPAKVGTLLSSLIFHDNGDCLTHRRHPGHYPACNGAGFSDPGQKSACGKSGRDGT